MPETIEILRSITSPISVVSGVGPQRLGKSTILNLFHRCNLLSSVRLLLRPCMALPPRAWSPACAVCSRCVLSYNIYMVRAVIYLGLSRQPQNMRLWTGAHSGCADDGHLDLAAAPSARQRFGESSRSAQWLVLPARSPARRNSARYSCAAALWGTGGALSLAHEWCSLLTVVLVFRWCALPTRKASTRHTLPRFLLPHNTHTRACARMRRSMCSTCAEAQGGERKNAIAPPLCLPSRLHVHFSSSRPPPHLTLSSVRFWACVSVCMRIPCAVLQLDAELSGVAH